MPAHTKRGREIIDFTAPFMGKMKRAEKAELAQFLTK